MWCSVNVDQAAVRLIGMAEGSRLNIYSSSAGLKVTQMGSIHLLCEIISCDMRLVSDIDLKSTQKKDSVKNSVLIAAMDSTSLTLRYFESYRSSQEHSKHQGRSVWREVAEKGHDCPFPEQEHECSKASVTFLSDSRLVVSRGDMLYVVTVPVKPGLTPGDKVDVRQLECITSTGRTLRSMQAGRYHSEKLLLASASQESFAMVTRNEHTDMADLQWCDLVAHQDLRMKGLDLLKLVVRWKFSGLALSCPLAVDSKRELVFAAAGGDIHILSRQGLVRTIAYEELKGAFPSVPTAMVRVQHEGNDDGDDDDDGVRLLLAGMGGCFAQLTIPSAATKKEDVPPSSTSVSLLSLVAVPVAGLVSCGPSVAGKGHVHVADKLCLLPRAHSDEHFFVLASNGQLGSQVLALCVREASVASPALIRHALRLEWGEGGRAMNSLDGISAAFVSAVSMNHDARPAESLLLTGGTAMTPSTLTRTEDCAELACVDALSLNIDAEGLQFFAPCAPALQQAYGVRTSRLGTLPVLVTSRVSSQSLLMELHVAAGGIVEDMDDEIEDTPRNEVDEEDDDAAAAASTHKSRNINEKDRDEASVCQIPMPSLVDFRPPRIGPSELATSSIDADRQTLLFAHIGNDAAVQVTTHNICIIDCSTLKRRGPLCPIKACRTDARRGGNRGAVFDTAEHATLSGTAMRLYYATNAEAQAVADVEACESFVVLTSGRFVMILSVNPVTGQTHYVTHHEMEDDISAVSAVRTVTHIGQDKHDGKEVVSTTLVLAIASWDCEGVQLLRWSGDVDRHDIDTTSSLSPRAGTGPSGGRSSPRGSPRPSQRSTSLEYIYTLPFDSVSTADEAADDGYIRMYGSLRHVLVSAVSDTRPLSAADKGTSGMPTRRGSSSAAFVPPTGLRLFVTCGNGAGDITIAEVLSASPGSNGSQDVLRAKAWQSRRMQRYLLRGGIVDIIALQMSCQVVSSSGSSNQAKSSKMADEPITLLGFLINGTRSDHLLTCNLPSCAATATSAAARGGGADMGTSSNWEWHCAKLANAALQRSRRNFASLPTQLLADLIPSVSATVAQAARAEGAHAFSPNIMQGLVFAWLDSANTSGRGRAATTGEPLLRVGSVLPVVRTRVQQSCILPGRAIDGALRADANGSSSRQPVPHAFTMHRHTSFKTYTADKAAMLLVLWKGPNSWGISKFDSTSLTRVWNMERTAPSDSLYAFPFAVVGGPLPFIASRRRPAGMARADFGDVFSVLTMEKGSDTDTASRGTSPTEHGIRVTAIHPSANKQPIFRALGELVVWQDAPPGTCDVPPLCQAFDIDGPAHFSGVIIAGATRASVVCWRTDFSDGVMDRAALRLSLQEASTVAFDTPAPVVEVTAGVVRGAALDKERAVLAISRRGWGVDLLEFGAQNMQLSPLRTIAFGGALTNLCLTIQPPTKTVGLGLYGPHVGLCVHLVCMDTERPHEMRRYELDARGPSDVDVEVCHVLPWVTPKTSRPTSAGTESAKTQDMPLSIERYKLVACSALKVGENKSVSPVEETYYHAVMRSGHVRSLSV